MWGVALSVEYERCPILRHDSTWAITTESCAQWSIFVYQSQPYPSNNWPNPTHWNLNFLDPWSKRTHTQPNLHRPKLKSNRLVARMMHQTATFHLTYLPVDTRYKATYCICTTCIFRRSAISNHDPNPTHWKQKFQTQPAGQPNPRKLWYNGTLERRDCMTQLLLAWSHGISSTSFAPRRRQRWTYSDATEWTLKQLAKRTPP